MGAGIARQIATRYPEALVADIATPYGDVSKLGTISVWAGPTFAIVNGYTQFRYGRDRRQVDYAAVRRVFEAVRTRFPGQRIAYPRIGAGLAGGDWPTIAAIIDEVLAGQDHSLLTGLHRA